MECAPRISVIQNVIAFWCFVIASPFLGPASASSNGHSICADLQTIMEKNHFVLAFYSNNMVRCHFGNCWNSPPRIAGQSTRRTDTAQQKEEFRSSLQGTPYLCVSATLRIVFWCLYAYGVELPVTQIHIKNCPDSVADDPYASARHDMVQAQIRKRGVKDESVLRVMATVPRHEFVPPQSRGMAYADEPVGIGGGQTISQPYIVAAMTEALQLRETDKVLDIGTGCGYQAAVLSLLSREVYSVEFRSDLASAAAERLQRLGFHNVHVRAGDGSMGLKEFAPYDAILVAAAAPSLPQPLLDQLADGGRMIAPIGTEEHQQLLLVTRHGADYNSQRREQCRFVPLVGRHGWHGGGLL
jgi:protein-L-isoaspartate(D-aspartate) O-methyltransferase